MMDLGLRVGDTIRCHDNDDMIRVMQELERNNVHTDFITDFPFTLVVVDSYGENDS